jgi:hypothetical protein
MRHVALWALFVLSFAAFAEEVPVCYNYGCAVRTTVEFSETELQQVGELFVMQPDAAGERAAIAKAIGLFETFTGQQTPTWADKGGNYNDDGVNGRMDCIDESTNSTAYLRLMERKGWLKFHRVLEPVDRIRFLIAQHWAAHIAEIAGGSQFVVDSWFFDNGHPAVVMPLEDWRHGAEPDE